jgi:hypothetical protein
MSLQMDQLLISRITGHLPYHYPTRPDSRVNKACGFLPVASPADYSAE